MPTRWTEERIDTIFDLQQGAELSPKRRQGINPHPFLRTSNVLWGHLDISVVDRMDFTADEVAKLALKKGDLLVCEGGEIGRTAMWNDELAHCCYQNHIHRLRSNGTYQIFPEFYMYWMQAAFLLLNRYEGQGNKTTIANLSGSRLNSFLVPYPPFQEQHAIARALGVVQEAKAARKREIKLERERKGALMVTLFKCGTREQATKHTEIGIMPDNWKIKLLKDVFTLTKKPKNLSYSDYQDVAFVPMDLVPIGHVYFQEYVLKKPEELTSGTYFEPGDLLLAKITPSFENGKQGIIKKLPAPFGVATTEVYPIKAVPDTSNAVFLFYYLLLEHVRSALAGKMEGTTGRQRLKRLSVETMKLPLPPLDEQQEIIQILTACDNRITALENDNKLLNELFCAMLKDLMAGQLPVTPLIEVVTDE